MLQDELSDLEKIRLEKVDRLRKSGVEPYPARSAKNTSSLEAIVGFEELEKQGETFSKSVVLAGRIRAMRPMGKLAFAHIEDGEGRVQLLLRVDELGEARMQDFVNNFDLGDYIEATGTMFRTKRGEVTLQVSDFRMLAKALFQLPAAKDEVVDGEVVRHSILSDPETRYRQRYVDLAVNPEVREIFKTRASLMRALRTFLDNHGFIEVETPILQPIYGGAAAKPFVTHHNQLHQDLYLRISFELYLKRLIVGGLDRVYEIGRDFRNEGVSFKHNPEFTQLEFYMAYADFHTIMDLTERMISFAASEVLGTQKITFDGQEIDLTPPWRRLEMRQGILEATGIDIDQCPDATSLSAAMTQKGIKHNPQATRGKLIGTILDEYLEPACIQPTFIYDYPREISPLAKNKPGDALMVERFEGFVGGMELCNAFSELNDPVEQEKRFLEMGRAYSADDEERHPMDEDYIRAMSYGMPPTGGFGIGVDRLMMLFSGRRNIREVILFPHLRNREDE